MNERAAYHEPAARTLRDALGEHPASLEVLAVLGALTDRSRAIGRSRPDGPGGVRWRRDRAAPEAPDRPLAEDEKTER